jgi:DNA-binding MarR family transcriptional regulator
MIFERLDLFKPSEEMRNLQFLEELEKNPVISQRQLSHKFNIALGVTNACLRNMTRKGWIRVQGMNRRKIGYYLTPKGMTEKAKLTFHLISYTVQYYSDLKKRIGQKFLEMEREGLGRIVFYGVSDEMEVAFITLQGVNPVRNFSGALDPAGIILKCNPAAEERRILSNGVNLRLVGIVEDDEKFRSQILFGYELERLSQIKELKPDSVLITSLTDIEKKRERIWTMIDRGRVRVSDICPE